MEEKSAVGPEEGHIGHGLGEHRLHGEAPAVEGGVPDLLPLKGEEHHLSHTVFDPKRLHPGGVAELGDLHGAEGCEDVLIGGKGVRCQDK